MKANPLDLKNARAYAKAAFAIAHEEGRVNEWGETLQAFANGLQPVQHLLSNPDVSRAQWVTIAGEIADKAELPVKEKALMMELAQKRYLHLLPIIATCFQALDNRAKGVEDVLITSAFAMSPEQVDDITSCLKKDFNVTSNKITVTVDKSLIGGAVVQFGDTVIDGSIKNGLLKMTKALHG